MPLEIERKFLLKNETWRDEVQRSTRMRQGYLATVTPESREITGVGASVRVRVAGDAAWLNVKSLTIGASRLEYEYAIPVSEASEMLDKLAGQHVDKTRHFIEDGDLLWEVDEFHGANHGLVVAEIELQAETDKHPQPDWLGEEVTQDVRYYNSMLAETPYSMW